MNKPLMICTLFLVLGCSSSGSKDVSTTPQADPRLRAHAGPRFVTGDPARGRQSFIDLHCNTCHAVAGDDMPRPANARKGLLLHDLDQLTAESVALKIVERSSVDPNAPRETEMAGFTDSMTLRQLADIVAFLRQARH